MWRKVPARDLWGMPVIVATLLLAPCSAFATDVCAVGKGADGYVALRATPSAQGALISRAREGDAVLIEKRNTGEAIESGSWWRVFHYPDSVVPPQTDPAYKKGRRGWMHKRYVVDCG